MRHVDRLFVSDLDGTLIDPQGAEERALARFRAFVHADPAMAVVHVTGRSFDHALEGIAATALPWPDLLVTSVGTESRVRVDGRGGSHAPRWRLDVRFHAEMAGRLGARPLAAADALVLAHHGVRLQDATEQSEFKRSYRSEGGISPSALRQAIVECLDRAGLACSVLASVDPQTGEGLIDLLPWGVTKATVIEHLRARWSLPDRQIVFAGDSGNDVAALRGSWNAILVGNATREVREQVTRARPPTEGTRCVPAEHPTLAGVLEGLEALGWIDR